MGPATLPSTFGPYRIQQKLGEGGMGAVYLAEDTRLERKVALKMPHFSGTDDNQVIERFQREARLAASIEHDNLCPVYEVGCIDGVHFLAMKYLEGTLLSRYISSHNPWPPATAVTLIRHLCAPLHLLHSRGIVHRDLKPSNIMIVEGRKPVLLDFGLARSYTSHSQHLTATGAQMGTPLYMSPEQAGNGNPIGPASDVYALGMILYELIVGQSPLAASTTMEIFARILYGQILPPSHYRPGLSPMLDALCLKTVSRNLAERYPSMAALAQALDNFLRDPASSQVPAGPPALMTPPSVPMAAMATMAQACPRCRSPLTYHRSTTSMICPRCMTTPNPAGARTGSMTVVQSPPPTRSLVLPMLTLLGTLSVAATTIGGMYLAGIFDPQPGSQSSSSSQPIANREGTIINSIGIRLVRIPAGKVWMGSPSDEPGRYDDEFQHEIEMTRPVHLGMYEVTQKEFETVMKHNPSWFRPGGGGADKIDGIDHLSLPVELVSWQEAREFCERLSALPEEQKAKRSYRLPTEAEWEYACRGGQTGAVTRPFALQTPLAELPLDQANFDGSDTQGKYLGRSNTVGKSGPPNAFGLYDMHGNVWEWCADWFGPYDPVARLDPTGPPNGTKRVVRGGSWNNTCVGNRAATRASWEPDGRASIYGFRVVCTAP